MTYVFGKLYNFENYFCSTLSFRERQTISFFSQFQNVPLTYFAQKLCQNNKQKNASKICTKCTVVYHSKICITSFFFTLYGVNFAQMCIYLQCSHGMGSFNPITQVFFNLRFNPGWVKFDR